MALRHSCHHRPKGVRRASFAGPGAALVAVAALAGAAISHAVPGPGGVITACYGGQGTWLVDSASQCGQYPGTQAVSWSQAGPQEPAGVPGATGPSGSLPPTLSGSLTKQLTADQRQLASLARRLAASTRALKKPLGGPESQQLAILQAQMRQMSGAAALLASISARSHATSKKVIANLRA